MTSEARAQALRTKERRQAIEHELAAQRELLEVNHATMTSPLTDAEGFPLASLDIPAICAARKRIHELLNDRRAMDEQMAQWLEVAMREAPTGTQRDQAAVGPPASADAPAPDNSDASARPVGVRSVAQNSPAAAAVRRSRRL